MRRPGAPAVRRLSLLDGADGAGGLCVVIDVFRAGTFACLALEKGADSIVPAGSVEEARALKTGNPGWILAGERGGVMLPGFDTGNSPTLLMEMDLRGRTVIHATSAGSRGVLRASSRCDAVIMACFSNARAAAGFVLSSGARLVTLLAMGDSGSTPAPEDEEFASFFESTLAQGGTITDPGPWLSRISASGATRRFLESVEASMPPGDASLCLTPDTCGSVPVLTVDGGGPPRLLDATRTP